MRWFVSPSVGARIASTWRSETRITASLPAVPHWPSSLRTSSPTWCLTGFIWLGDCQLHATQEAARVGFRWGSTSTEHGTLGVAGQGEQKPSEEAEQADRQDQEGGAIRRAMEG